MLLELGWEGPIIPIKGTHSIGTWLIDALKNQVLEAFNARAAHNSVIITQRRSKWGVQGSGHGCPTFCTLNFVMVITAAINLVMIVNSFGLFGNGHHC